MRIHGLAGGERTVDRIANEIGRRHVTLTGPKRDYVLAPDPMKKDLHDPGFFQVVDLRPRHGRRNCHGHGNGLRWEIDGGEYARRQSVKQNQTAKTVFRPRHSA